MVLLMECLLEYTDAQTDSKQQTRVRTTHYAPDYLFPFFGTGMKSGSSHGNIREVAAHNQIYSIKCTICDITQEHDTAYQFQNRIYRIENRRHRITLDRVSHRQFLHDIIAGFENR